MEGGKGRKVGKGKGKETRIKVYIQTNLYNPVLPLPPSPWWKGEEGKGVGKPMHGFLKGGRGVGKSRHGFLKGGWVKGGRAICIKHRVSCISRWMFFFARCYLTD